MSTKGNINLLRSSSSISLDVIEWVNKLRLFNITGLVCVVIIGVGLGVGYSVFASQKQTLEADKQRLITQINSQSTKQALVTNIQFRIGLIQRIFSTQRQWEGVLSTILDVAHPPVLKSFTVSDTKLVSLTLFSDTFDQTKTMIDAVSALSTQQKMKNPTLESLQVDTQGKVQMAVSFFPAF